MDTPASRFLEIREALKLTQAQMAYRLTRLAGDIGLDVLYDTAMVSKIEQGVRKLGLLDGILVARLDPKGRGILWLAAGIEPHDENAPHLEPVEGEELLDEPEERPARARGRAGAGRRRSR